jgi:hypothetical protein
MESFGEVDKAGRGGDEVHEVEVDEEEIKEGCCFVAMGTVEGVMLVV